MVLHIPGPAGRLLMSHGLCIGGAHESARFTLRGGPG
jgi:hypothetical protein